jgi:ABC-type uncharacterized transport system permease subunit
MHTKTLGGWDIYQVLFLYAFSQTISIIHGAWTKGGLNSLANELIRLGDYDFYRTKPFDAMTLVSISKPRAYALIKLLFNFSILIFALVHCGPLPLINYFWFLILFILSFFLYYAIKIVTVVPSFWVIKSWGLTDLMDKLSNLMRYPASVYPWLLNFLLSTVFPILAITYLPVKTLLFEPKLSQIAYMFALTAIFMLIARLIWRLGEKRYGSASS